MKGLSVTKTGVRALFAADSRAFCLRFAATGIYTSCLQGFHRRKKRFPPGNPKRPVIFVVVSSPQHGENTASWLRHFIGYFLGTSKKKASAIFYGTAPKKATSANKPGHPGGLPKTGRGRRSGVRLPVPVRWRQVGRIAGRMAGCAVICGSNP